MSGAYKNLQTELGRYADDDYRRFIMQGIPSERPFIGVRVPHIQEIVDSLPRESYVEIISTEPVTFEEVLVRGMVIAKLPYDEMLNYFDSQVDYIDDWCNCDIFCSRLRPHVKKHLVDFFELKVDSLLGDKREYAVRVGLVLLKSYYVNFDYLFTIFDRVERLMGREEYYIRMGIAWLVAECFIKYPEETLGFLKTTKLPKWTYNKTISKICDSRRVEGDAKDLLRKFRK